MIRNLKALGLALTSVFAMSAAASSAASAAPGLFTIQEKPEVHGGQVGTDTFTIGALAPITFKPRLTLKLRGGTRRGAHPALQAVVRPRPGDANFGEAIVTLPRSAFLDQAHIRTICTRVQFAAQACPRGSVYGKAKAFSPLLDEPAEGPVYLRSSDNNLPDLVAALKGPPSAAVDVELVGRIDSHRGGIRSSFESIPDVPVSRFVLSMQFAAIERGTASASDS